MSEAAALNPGNPFYTPQYSAYRQEQGFEPWILQYSGNGPQAVIRCSAFMRSGKLKRKLEVPSMPNVDAAHSFWQGLHDFCRKYGVTDLSVYSFGSEGGSIPSFDGEIRRRARWEYLLDLASPDLFRKMRKGHAYSIKKGRKSGLTVRGSHDRDAVKVHQELMESSMERQKDRGKNVSTSVQLQGLQTIVQSGAATVFQALLDGRVVSSNIILMAEKSGYNHTQGTGPEGRECGAAHFLIHEIACMLRDEGKTHFNLGGTDDADSGVNKFKTGFGLSIEERELESAAFKVCGTASSLLRRTFAGGDREYDAA